MHKGSHIVKNYHEEDAYEYLKGDGRYIVKLHGGLNTPANVIFTRKEYAESRIKYQSFYGTVDACLLTHIFIFLGCGYNDPDISLLLENQSFSYPSNIPHYIVVPAHGNDDLKISLRENKI